MPADAAPHVVGLGVVVIAVEDVPALHEGRVLGEHGILHVLEVVLGHLVVHLVLELVQVDGHLALLALLLQAPVQELLRALPVLPGAQEAQGHVLPGRGRVEDHHLNRRDLPLQRALHTQQRRLVVRLGQEQADVVVVLLLSVGLLEERQDLAPCFLDLGAGADDGDLLVFLLNVVERVIDFSEGHLPTDAELCHPWFFL